MLVDLGFALVENFRLGSVILPGVAPRCFEAISSSGMGTCDNEASAP